MLDYPPCPACGGKLPLTEFFEEWDPAGRYKAANAALECPSCFAKLKPQQLRAQLLMVAALIASFVVMAMGLHFFRGNDLGSLVTGAAFVASLFWIQSSFLRRLITWRVAKPGEPVNFMLPTRADRDQLEAAARAEAEADRADAAREAAQYPPWNCLTCGEENPGHFELCWKCRPTECADKDDNP